ncbi:Ger(x)C family spore germination protein [Neobacillus muris]|uniref:Ger(x)C family spore germination protein n=1 Tax=Neobacillus muris TaxID=2941334 RepID=UPI0020412A36|nr:Ger(x)C family spore germination protein [Neobacillus muris]
MRKGLIFVSSIVIMIPFLTACWNQKELTDLAFVMAMGVDKGKEKKFEVSFQIVNPGNVAPGQIGGGQGLPIAVYKSTGDTLTEAARAATKKVSRRLYYAHTNLVIISDDVAKKDLLLLLDAMDRDPEFRTTTELIIAKGKTRAEDLVSALTILDKLPVNKITKEIQSTEKMLGENMSINIDDFITNLISKGREPILNGYKVVGKIDKVNQAVNLKKTTTDAYLAADGLAVFKDGKLRGWINNNNARGVLWILNKVEGTGINLTWKDMKNAISIALIRSKTKVSAQFKGGKPMINVKIENEGWVSEVNTAIDLTNPKEIEKIESILMEETKKQILTSVKKAQKLKVDIFGFGEKIHLENPKRWKMLQKNWDEEFSKLQVNVEVESYIRREGIRTKPFWSEFSK